MITQADINKIVQTIVDGFAPDKIILFGSYANGTANAESDVDLLIVKETSEKPNKRAISLYRLFPNYNVALDILVYTPDEYSRYCTQLNNISFFATKTGKVIYEH